MTPLRVAYFGRQGSFSHQTARQRFGSKAIYLSCPTHPEVVDALLQRKASVGVLPLENSVAGVVMESIDAMLSPQFARSKLKIQEVLQIAPQLALMGGVPPRQTRRLYSHPFPLRYLSAWIKKNLPETEIFETVSTSEAAQLASEQPGAAAIASPQAAGIYHLKIQVARLSKPSEYLTRFCVLANRPTDKSLPTHLSCCFGLRHKPGSLVEALSIFADHGLNLTRIISRPLALRSGKFNPDAFIFWTDVDIRVPRDRLQSALKKLKKNTTLLDLVGQYRIRKI